MPRKKAMQQEEERWITAREATDILKKNSGREDIPDSYVRTLAYPRRGNPPVIASRPVTRGGITDPRIKEYRLSDVENYVVGKRDKGKGDTVAARKAGSRRKSSSSNEPTASA